ncbi:MAG: VC2046/SO_2500 family protein [Psychromonas sp.]
MNNKQIEAGLLINEWQLGTQLNVAVSNGTREKFNLLLSLLSADVCDFSQFELPKATQYSLTPVELRQYFSLAETQPLVNQGMSLAQAEKISISVHKKNLVAVRLQSLLNNEAILSRYHAPHFDSDVVDNLSFLSQTRLKNTQSDEEQSELTANGIDHQLMENYQALNFDDKPLKVTYM